MAQTPLESEQQHRRESRLQIVLPVAGGFIVLLLLTLLAGTLPPRGRSLVADFMLTVTILCPAFLCLFALYMIMVIVVALMARANSAAARPLRGVHRITDTMRQRTETIMDSAAQRSIEVNARLAPLDKLIFSAFDPKPSRTKDVTDESEKP